ncbi:MAG: hypothetical protein CVV64_05205 [Candidatus Wallbacteria bacterium HGW-Wallbacteria-1]|jgi:hypothetical protein|uniref:Uncharacterized protein n=1 Tax=Candidatus Wallbacteria bacterium HGW-Wallbacteria-1 TaxID=2013854 RepID=A0A2N1PS41_9BACT|nr:MAG: hypothetical protein CVV64_05205 [Candidatus Wallbacteria bacterium HGW-Wallbacteria-1]
MNLVIAANLPFSDQVSGYTGVGFPSHLVFDGKTAATIMVENFRRAIEDFREMAESDKFEELSAPPMTVLVLDPCEKVPHDLPDGVLVHRVAPTDVKGGIRILQELPDRGWTFFASADCVMMTAEDISTFLADASAYSTEIMVPLVDKGNFLNEFPGVEKHFFKLVEGKFALGRAFLARTVSARKGAHKASGIAELAEDPIELAKSMGLKLSMKYAIGRLSIADVENFADSHLGVNCKLVSTSGAGLTLAATTVSRIVTAQRHFHGETAGK